MDYKISSLQPILHLLQNEGPLKAGEIAKKTGKSSALTHRYLKKLLEDKKIESIGKTPHTQYKILGDSFTKSQKIHQEDAKISLDYQTRKILDEIFLKFSPTGKRYIGAKGMQQWCEQRNLNFQEKSSLYLDIYAHIQKKQDNCGLLKADEAFGKDFEINYLDRVYYADQYKYMEFGRGKLAELTFYGKQSQNQSLIGESIEMILPKLECLIAREKFDAIAITPWSIYRKNQLLALLKKSLEPQKLPFIQIEKYYENGIIIPQKSLKTRGERIENAQNTIFIHDKNIGKYKKILLIDDFVGSGATLNITAKKLKDEGVKEIIGFAFVGNLNLSYEVIREI